MNQNNKKPFKMEVFVVLSAVLMLVVAVPAVNSVDIPTAFHKMIANCLDSNDTVTCLSIKGIMALNRAARSENIEILPGIISIKRYKCDLYVFFFLFSNKMIIQ